MVFSTRLLSTRHEVEDERAALDVLHEKGWTDGLPVVPPTPERVLACLEAAALAPDQVVGIDPILSGGRPGYLCGRDGWPDQVHWSKEGHVGVGGRLLAEVFSDCE